MYYTLIHSLGLNVKQLIKKLTELNEDKKQHKDDNMENLLQLIANIFENDNDTNGMEQDIGGYGE
jgi:hypothetical protein